MNKELPEKILKEIEEVEEIVYNEWEYQKTLPFNKINNNSIFRLKMQLYNHILSIPSTYCNNDNNTELLNLIRIILTYSIQTFNFHNNFHNTLYNYFEYIKKHYSVERGIFLRYYHNKIKKSECETALEIFDIFNNNSENILYSNEKPNYVCSPIEAKIPFIIGLCFKLHFDYGLPKREE